MCQSPTCDSEDQARRHVDQVPLVFPTEDGFWCTRDACAECWTLLHGGVRSIRSVKKEQRQRRKRGGLEIQPFGHCWIEQALRRMYIEVTRELHADFNVRKEALVVSGEVLDRETLKESVEELFPFY